MRSVIFILALFVISCYPPNVTVEPDARAAYTADQVVIRINRLQNVAIEAQKGGALSTDDTRIIVEFALSANTTLKSVPDGWQKTVMVAWQETKKKLSMVANQSVLAAMDSVDIILATFLP
jgi:hypothetical protein